jgi:predicted PurR-regulated permease PerM
VAINYTNFPHIFSPAQLTISYTTQLEKTLANCERYLNQKAYGKIKQALINLERITDTIPKKQAFYMLIICLVLKTTKENTQLNLLKLLPESASFISQLNDNIVARLFKVAQKINKLIDYHKQATGYITKNLNQLSLYSESTTEYQDIMKDINQNITIILNEPDSSTKMLLLIFIQKYCDEELENLRQQIHLWHAKTIGHSLRKINKDLREEFERELKGWQCTYTVPSYISN